MNWIKVTQWHASGADTSHSIQRCLTQLPSISVQLTATSEIGILSFCAMYNNSASNAL